MRSRAAAFGWLTVLGLAVFIAYAPGPARASGDQAPAIPPWLAAHVGDAEGEISLPVLQRARALYRRKVSEGEVGNPCYFAMDATRPNSLSDGTPGRRFYIVCEAEQSFRAISSGHGSGRNLKGIANFANGRTCAANFGNAVSSNLTTGGSYVTAEAKTSFKGYFRASSKRDEALTRTFIQFEGEGDTANARQREIGGHAAVLLRGVCLLKKPKSPYANGKGYVPLGKLVQYAGGRSNGCTSWAQADAEEIVAMTKSNPTTLYIYPEASDIRAVARATASGQSLSNAGLYWNAACLKQIGTPQFWPQETLGPVIAQYQRDHPPPPPRPTPICASR